MAEENYTSSFLRCKSGLSKASSISSIDPDLIKFYQAFQDQRAHAKLPVKPGAVSFKHDLNRLRRAASDMRKTLKKVEFGTHGLLNYEEVNSSRKGDDTLNIHHRVKNEQAERIQGKNESPLLQIEKEYEMELKR